MAYKLIISNDAHRDIHEIISYIAYELKNREAAISFLDEIEKSYLILKETPLIYSLCADKRLRKAGYRKITIKNYLVLYRVDESQKHVFIARTVYSFREYCKLL